MASTNFCDITSLRVMLVQHAAEIKHNDSRRAKLAAMRWTRTSIRQSRLSSVAIDGPKAGQWYDHENGEGGDLSAEDARSAPQNRSAACDNG
jgi:hypothetical protein